MTGTLSNPVVGEPNSTGDPKIVALVKQWNEKIDSENKVPDTSLSSPNNSAYRVIISAQSYLAADQVAATLFLTGGNAVASGGTAPTPPCIFYFDDADYTVAGKTQKLRLRAQVSANATKPTIKFTFGFYPITVAGGADALTVTLGTVVSGSTVEINEPAASAVTNTTGSDFTIPSDGAYVLGVVTSGTLTNNSAVAVTAQLQTRSV